MIPSEISSFIEAEPSEIGLDLANLILSRLLAVYVLFIYLSSPPSPPPSLSVGQTTS